MYTYVALVTFAATVCTPGMPYVEEVVEAVSALRSLSSIKYPRYLAAGQ